MGKKSTDPYKNYRTTKEFNKTNFPKPIFDEQPELVDFYYKAWELAWSHILHREDMPQKDYMDEAMIPNQIWIWDTCFMSLFSRYAFNQVPGIESLNNFYKMLYEKDLKNTGFRSAKIHFADNPPLFAWIEWEYVKFTGDIERIRNILEEKRYLQKHFSYMEEARSLKKPHYVLVKARSGQEKYGYRWQGNRSGMDNTPRGRTKVNNSKWNRRGQLGKNNIYWVDMIAQQALSAKYIVELAKLIKNIDIIEEYTKKYQYLAQLLNYKYWSSEDKMYYDILRKEADTTDEKRFNKVLTPASYWPMIAEVPTQEQAKSLDTYANDPDYFGGLKPWVSLSRKDPEFDPLGRYWRGGIWLPTAYMGTKALEKYGFFQTADDLSKNLLNHMLKTHNEFSPHTIWETYSPSESKPSTQKREHHIEDENMEYVRPDFCGWSALGPISMFIENVLGFHEVNYLNKEIIWRIPNSTQKIGIENLKFGDITTSLIYENDTLRITSTHDYTLKVVKDRMKERQTISIKKGTQKNQLF